MHTGYFKYCIRFLTIISLSGFLYTNLSVYMLLTESCSVEEMSCSCKHSKNNSVTVSKHHKSCCCEITEIPEHQSEATLISTDTNPKNPEIECKEINLCYSLNSISDFNHKVSTFQNPPGYDLNILNSIFRI